MVLTNNEVLAPFLSDNISLRVGLNPLGMQNAATDAYANLLPGLNNVSGRIRYYSFYCWLFENYYIQNKNISLKDQREYIRKAEYLLALINAMNNDSEGIPGINYALTKIESTQQEFNLREGIYNSKGKTDKTYWQYSSGIFGQYYAGVARDLAIIGNLEGAEQLYAIKNNGDYINGKILAEAFNENISIERKNIFFECIKKEYVSRDSVKYLLQEFNMKLIPENTREQEMLIKMLLQKDYPHKDRLANNRFKTIISYLTYIEQNEEEINKTKSFPHFMYQNYINSPTDDFHQEGWYYYYINEAWQYHSLVIFDSILTLLNKEYGSQYIDMDMFVSRILTEIQGILDNYYTYRLQDFIEDIKQDKIENNINASSLLNNIILSLCEILLLFDENKDNKERLKHIKMGGISNYDRDWLIFEQSVYPFLSLPVNEFISYYIVYNN